MAGIKDAMLRAKKSDGPKGKKGNNLKKHDCDCGSHSGGCSAGCGCACGK